jgi:ParB-like chromosome segregation protein Spo0J
VATLPANDVVALHAEPLSDFVLIRTDQIDTTDRLRDIDPVWAQALGRVMLREGQRTPIEVCRLPGANSWRLVTGGHRVAGAEFAGIEELRAEIVSAAKVDRRMREVSENLWRRDLDPVDRAAFIAELVSLRRTQAGLAEAGHRGDSVRTAFKARIAAEADDTLETISNVYGFTEEVGTQLGLTGRTIRNDLLLYRGLSPTAIERLRAASHSSARNATQLRALAKLERPQQDRVVELLTVPGASLGYGVPRTIAEAIAHQLGPKPAKAIDAGAKRLSAFIGAFQRMTLAEKKGALAHLGGLLPTGFVVAEHGGTVAPVGGAVLSKQGAETMVTAISVAEFYHGLVTPAPDSAAREEWASASDAIKRAKRLLDGSRRPE